MRILFIIPEEFEGERWGGVTTYTIELAKELRKLGYDISILTPGFNESVIVRYGIRIYKTAHAKTSHVGGFFLKVTRRLSPDIIESLLWAQDVVRFVRHHGPFDVVEAPEWGSSTLFLSPTRRSKIVVRLHSSWLMYKVNNKLPITLHDRVTDFFERWCIVSASAVTSPTKYMVAQYPFLRWVLRMRKVPVFIIPNGLQLSKRHQGAGTLPFEPYILSVGRIEIAKGSLLLCDAFVRLHKKHKKLHLVFVGEDINMFIEGKWESCIAHIRNRLPPSARDRVHFVHKQTREALRKYYRNCLFYIIPSYGHENPSLALLEALSFGKAAIGSDVGGIPEVLHHKQNGLLFHEGDSKDLEEKIRFMIRHPAFRRRCERQSLSQLSAYDIRTTAQQTLKVYLAI